MRLLHIADLHLGAPMQALSDAELMRECRTELMQSLGRAVELGVKNGVGAVLIAGDLFDSESVSERVLMQVCTLIASYAPLPFFYVTGNHERDALISRADKPKNLYTFTSGISGYDLGEVCILGTNESTPHMLKNLRTDASKRNVFLFHGELREHSDFGGVIGLRDLSHRGIDYLALGHYHSFSVREIEGGGVAVYAGIPEGRGFDELGKKGVVIFDTADCKPVFYPIAKRTYHKIELEVGAFTSVEELLLGARDALSECQSEDLVRLVLTGERPLSLRIDHGLIRLHLEDRVRYFELIDETKARDTKDELRYDRSIRGEFMRLVLADDALSEAQKREIIDCGLLALSGEEMGL